MLDRHRLVVDGRLVKRLRALLYSFWRFGVVELLFKAVNGCRSATLRQENSLLIIVGFVGVDDSDLVRVVCSLVVLADVALTPMSRYVFNISKRFDLSPMPRLLPQFVHGLELRRTILRRRKMRSFPEKILHEQDERD